MSAIAGSFFSQFPATGELGLSLTSIQGGSATEANAAAINASASTDSSSPFSLLATSSATVSSSPTINALQSGELSTENHNVIAAIGNTSNDQLVIPWNANGTEPSTLANLRQLGWIKILSEQTTPGDPKPSGANYTLTPVGQAIFKRTVASTLGAGAQAAINSTLQAETSQLASTLSALGVNISA